MRRSARSAESCARCSGSTERRRYTEAPSGAGPERLAHLLQETGRCERLLDECAGGQHAVLANDVAGIPRHVHDLVFGAYGPHPFGKLTAVHDRHHDVGEQEVDGALVLTDVVMPVM